MAAPRKYPDELRERAIRLVDGPGGRSGWPSDQRGVPRVGEQLGINADTLRNWVKQARVDAGERPGPTTADRTRIAELEREVRELRRANAILKTASAFFAAELDRPSATLIAYIDQHKDEFGVEPICRALTEAGAKIAPSTYYAARTRPPSARAVRDAAAGRRRSSACTRRTSGSTGSARCGVSARTANGERNRWPGAPSNG